MIQKRFYSVDVWFYCVAIHCFYCKTRNFRVPLILAVMSYEIMLAPLTLAFFLLHY